MASREHRSGNTRVKVATINTNVVAFVERGAEAWRERRHTIPGVWWNPFSWGGYEWRREGTPPITNVDFIGVDGKVIAQSRLNPKLVNETGYQKLSCVYFFTHTAPPPDILGTDARSVANVKVTYTPDWEENPRTLSDH